MSPETESKTAAVAAEPEAKKLSFEQLTARYQRLRYKIAKREARMASDRAIVDEAKKEIGPLRAQLDAAIKAGVDALADKPVREPKPGDVTVGVPTGNMSAKSSKE